MLRNRQQNMSSIEYGRVTIAHCQRELAECKHYADVCASSAGSFLTQMVGTKWDKHHLGQQDAQDTEALSSRNSKRALGSRPAHGPLVVRSTACYPFPAEVWRTGRSPLRAEAHGIRRGRVQRLAGLK